MKLHLPKLLLTVTLAAMSIAQGGTVTSVNLHTGSNNLPSKEANWYTFATSDVELGTGDKLGAFDANGNEISLGQTHYDKPFLGSWTAKATGNVTKNVKVDGTLTINDDARVVLGGQYKLSSTTSSSDEYTGIVADKVVVNGNGSVTNLSSWNATVNTLEVNSGKVALHNKVQSGNNHFVYELNDSKQVRIKKALNINGGETVINLNQLDSNNAANDTHVFTGFGNLEFTNPSYFLGILTGADSAKVTKAWINQTAGILTVNGKTASVGGLNINQSGGTMNISTAGTTYHSWHILSDYGDSTIIQSGDSADTVLNIGGIKAYNGNYDTVLKVLLDKGVTYNPDNGNLEYQGEKVEINPSIAITQSGKGTINIIKGIDLTNQKTGAASIEKSSISQSGGGIINLNGEYKGVTFDITLNGKGGTLNVNSNLSVGTVTQAAGTINVAENATLTADQIVVTSGTFVNKGTINYTPSAAMLALGSAEDNALLALAGTTEEADIVVAGGQFVNIGNVGDVLVQEGGTLTIEAGSTSNSITMEGGQIDITGNSSTGSLTLNGGVINFVDGATVTLSEGATLDISENATIMITVDSSVLQDLAGKDFTLFAGVDNAAEALGNADIVFTDGVEEKEVTISSGSTSGSITVTEVVPEPTTATLSLLALAALAARRRRK